MTKSLLFNVEIAAVSVALLCGCDRAVQDPPRVAAPAVAVQVAQPGRGAITRSVTLPAVVKPNQQVVLYAKVAGYLKYIKVDRGDQVKEGDNLAEVEAPELVADQARYRAQVEVAKDDFNRLAEAQKKAPDLVVPLTVDTARGKYEMALAELKRNETLLGYTRIVAPFSGTITRRWVDVGALIPAATTSSLPQSAAVVTLVDDSIVRVEVAVPALEAPLVKKGLGAEMRLEELSGKVFKGTVSRFADALDDATRTMMAEIDLPNPGHELRAGMFATVTLAIESKSDALLIPLGALIVEKARTSVFVLDGLKAKKVPVKTGFQDGKAVEILEGLNGSERVILAGKIALADGQSVTITEGK